MSHTGWPEQFEKILRNNLTELEPGTEIRPDSVLNQLGLDSMGTVALLMDLEETFDVTIPDEHLATLLTSGSVRELWSLVNDLRA
ncbi:phosphopantetheine-binding protein [Streptomyces sp. NPDC050164]|uniref:phosphopantetheine-binding protein n=1 Tax=Streptomyces sp. NPDC050164 TaxID=3365605 RepID=UPI003799B772